MVEKEKGERRGKRILLRTFGCQMNFYDAEVASAILKLRGYTLITETEEVAEPKTGEKREWYDPPADIVIMNTCSVREHAEDRIYSRLGMLKVAKQKKPDMLIGLMGCMVEEHKDKLFKKYPHLDFMVGTRNLKDLPSVIEEVRERNRQASVIRQEGISIEYTELLDRKGQFHAAIPIMTGCDKVCTFCIVPKTRGREVSMKAREVYREACRVVDQGVVWITLLGQNVNSYCGEEEGRPHIAFPELLDMLCEIPGLKRLSFTTSHPHDATEELFQVMARQPKISRRFHLPIQSGSDKILKRMKRLHTFDEYRQKIHRLRELIPDISITTDIISGFSGETPEDHAATVRMLQEIEFDGAYIYKYSLRPGTPAARLPDDVPLKIKEDRNHELLKIQKEIASKKNAAWIGKIVTAFLEAPSPRNPNTLFCRTDQDRKVNVPAEKSLIGQFAKIRLDSLKNETFSGTLLEILS